MSHSAESFRNVSQIRGPSCVLSVGVAPTVRGVHVGPVLPILEARLENTRVLHGASAARDLARPRVALVAHSLCVLRSVGELLRVTDALRI